MAGMPREMNQLSNNNAFTNSNIGPIEFGQMGARQNDLLVNNNNIIT